jgi:hypothetical protein
MVVPILSDQSRSFGLGRQNILFTKEVVEAADRLVVVEEVRYQVVEVGERSKMEEVVVGLSQRIVAKVH